MSKLKNGMKSLFKIAENKAKGIDQSVPKHVSAARMNTCLGCDKYLKATGQCKECLCFLKFKTTIAQESCPLKKWSAFKDEEAK